MSKICFYDFDNTIGRQDFVYFFATISMEKSLEKSKALPLIYKMKAQHENGDDVYVLTARAFSKSAQKGIQSFLARNGIHIPKDRIIMVGGAGKPKADVIRKFIGEQRNIEFHDDISENIKAVKEIGSPYIRTFWIAS